MSATASCRFSSASSPQLICTRPRVNCVRGAAIVGDLSGSAYHRVLGYRIILTARLAAIPGNGHHDRTMSEPTSAPSTYIHGTAPTEQQRLSILNDIINEASLREIALRCSDRVLDVGS